MSLARNIPHSPVISLIGLLLLVSIAPLSAQDVDPTAPQPAEIPAAPVVFRPPLPPMNLDTASSSSSKSILEAAGSRPPWLSLDLLPPRRGFPGDRFPAQEQDFKPVSNTSASRNRKSGFQWMPALRESLLFLGLEHGVRFALDPPTRRGLQGPFLGGYVNSILALKKRWGDGDPFVINYIGHPIQGSITSFIQIQNDPKGRVLEFGWTRDYWSSRLKAAAWDLGYSTYFELGFPVSEASLGHVGVNPGRTARQGWVDLVITPTMGSVWMITEDLLERYVVHPTEYKHRHPWTRAILRSILTPSRSFANMLRFKEPWHRDGRGGVTQPVDAAPREH